MEGKLVVVYGRLQYCAGTYRRKWQCTKEGTLGSNTDGARWERAAPFNFIYLVEARSTGVEIMTIKPTRRFLVSLRPATALICVTDIGIERSICQAVVLAMGYLQFHSPLISIRNFESQLAH